MRMFSFLLVVPALWAVAAQDGANAGTLAGNINAEHEVRPWCVSVAYIHLNVTDLAPFSPMPARYQGMI